jgi:hypothetical protein
MPYVTLTVECLAVCPSVRDCTCMHAMRVLHGAAVHVCMCACACRCVYVRVCVPQGHEDEVRAVAWSPHGAMLATGKDATPQIAVV